MSFSPSMDPTMNWSQVLQIRAKREVQKHHGLNSCNFLAHSLASSQLLGLFAVLNVPDFLSRDYYSHYSKILCSSMGDKNFHIAMYPWFAMGHLTSFLHLSNKLAKRGHKIFFFVPSKTLQKLEQFNLHRDLITFIPVTVPHVEGLPPGSETTADIAYSLQPYLLAAIDLTQPSIEAFLKEHQPQFVFFDYTYWLPSIAHPLGIKTIYYSTISSATTGYLMRETGTFKNIQFTEADMMKPPPGFPASSMIELYADEARQLSGVGMVKHDENISFVERLFTSLTDCDAIAFKSCREMEGPYCDYVENHFKRPILLAGPVVPEQPTSKLDEKWEKWLDAFKPNSVIFCSFGSEYILGSDQFQELLLGFELTNLPFLAALRPPVGVDSVEAALTEGFKERTQERGAVHGGWMQQQLLLAHPSVGCFVTHCGYGSLSEGLVNTCQLVLLPRAGDQFINARVMGRDLKVGVEVEKGEDGAFTKHNICKAIQSVMDIDSEIGKEVRENHSKFRELLSKSSFEDSYLDNFVEKLQELLQ